MIWWLLVIVFNIGLFIFSNTHCTIESEREPITIADVLLCGVIAIFGPFMLILFIVWFFTGSSSKWTLIKDLEVSKLWSNSKSKQEN